MEAKDYQRQCVTIDDQNLHVEFCRVPADFAYWSSQYAGAKDCYMKAKLEREITRARLRMELREMLVQSGERVTEARIDSEVDVNPEWEDVRTREIEAEIDVVRLHGVLESIRTKREMLISLGAHVRQEMKAI